jgi:NAD(P)H-hydrate epimerase
MAARDPVRYRHPAGKARSFLMRIASVEQMRRMDRRAIDEFGIRDELLMENAALAAFHVLSERLGVTGNRFAVLCGAGNNGGDGLVMARKILSNGGRPVVLALGDPEKYRGAARLNWEIISRLPLPVVRAQQADEITPHLEQCDVIVDAVFGTGLAREVTGRYRQIIEAVNRSGRPVFAVDIPSGINGDTGQVMGTAVRADVTVTFGLPKIGNLLYPGFAHCGRLYVTHISFPPVMTRDESLRVGISPPVALPPRDPGGHKGSFGKVLFIAGAAAYLGAPYFAAMSFLKAGGGYARLATPASVAPHIAARGNEIVMVPQQETAAGSISEENLDALLALAGRMDMVVMGPGLSLDPETVELACKLAAGIDKPLLVDGDGITALSAHPEILAGRRAATVLTPHLGEMARLAGTTIDAVDGDKIGSLQAQANRLQSVVVLKGAHSLVGYPDGQVLINMSGNSGMGSAGSGDVLGGTIAAMSGLGLPLDQAVAKGVFMHGLAGDLAAAELGEDGLTAGDILAHLPAAVSLDRRGLPDDLRRRYAGLQLI